MKKYQDIKSINESSAEETLMDNLFSFYLKKYSDSSVQELETHFLIALSSLVERGEIDLKCVNKFLDDKGIEGELPKKLSSRSITSDGCGSSSSYRSHC